MARLRYTAPKSNKTDKLVKICLVTLLCMFLCAMSFITSYNLVAKADDYSEVIRGLKEQVETLNTELNKKQNEITALTEEVERLKVVEEAAIEIPVDAPVDDAADE